VDAQPLYYGNKPRPGRACACMPKWSKCHVYLKRGKTLRVRRGERKTSHRVRVLESMLRQVWREYRYQEGIAFPELDSRFMFIYEGRVFRIRPQGMIIFSPIHYQTFKEICNTAWCVTVLILEYTLAMSKFIKEGVVTEPIPNDRDFAKLTWIPREVDPSLPIPSTESRRHANLSKRDPGHVMWWAHNDIQIHDQDWDLNMAYFSNQMNEEGLPAP
jgi:hypothetical protein